MTPGWALCREPPAWVVALEPLTTGMLGQEGLKLWVLDLEGVRAAVGIRAGGVVYPVFPDPPHPRWEAGARAILNQVANPWCLMGPTPWVTRAEPLMPPSVLQHRVEYEFLVLLPSLATPQAGPGVVRKAEPGDANALFPLQEGYEKEEVLFVPGDFQPLASRLHLGKLLRTQEIVALWENGKPVAKAGTNALTPTWGQVGGVYTRPEHRGRGLQKRLMTFLIHRLALEGRGACLFVKKTNQVAVGLYRSLGFAQGGEFLITYGERH